MIRQDTDFCCVETMTGSMCGGVMRLSDIRTLPTVKHGSGASNRVDELMDYHKTVDAMSRFSFVKRCYLFQKGPVNV